MTFAKPLSVGKVVDYSMLSAAEVEKRKINEADTYQGGNHAFDDLTDIQNDEFIVSFQLLILTSELIKARIIVCLLTLCQILPWHLDAFLDLVITS